MGVVCGPRQADPEDHLAELPEVLEVTRPPEQSVELPGEDDICLSCRHGLLYSTNQW
jgi:hypothetical protein